MSHLVFCNKFCHKWQGIRPFPTQGVDLWAPFEGRQIKNCTLYTTKVNTPLFAQHSNSMARPRTHRHDQLCFVLLPSRQMGLSCFSTLTSSTSDDSMPPTPKQHNTCFPSLPCPHSSLHHTSILHRQNGTFLPARRERRASGCLRRSCCFR